MTAVDLSQIKSLITSANTILIFVPQNPNLDNLAAGLSLFLGLSSAGKKVAIACPDPTRVEFNHLVGIDKIVDSLPGKNFIISLDYVEGAIEKVSYNITGDKFNLVIEPKVGAPTFSSEKVHYTTAGAQADLIITVDVQKTDQLGKFYTDNPDLFVKAAVLNLDYHQENSNFGKINLVDPSFFGVSEMASFLLKNLGINITADMATNLLAGITFTSNNFSADKSGPGTFEAAAICLRAGGKRDTTISTHTSITPAFSEAMADKVGEPKESIPVSQAPADWLQPKIFKSKSQPVPVPSGESTTI